METSEIEFHIADVSHYLQEGTIFVKTYNQRNFSLFSR
jgi:exoribonuclease R